MCTTAYIASSITSFHCYTTWAKFTQSAEVIKFNWSETQNLMLLEVDNCIFLGLWWAHLVLPHSHH